jgi:hypothetical protein
MRYEGRVLSDYLPEGSYRFQMQFAKGTFREFYSPTRENEEILRERRHWLKEAPQRYLAVDGEVKEIVAEFGDMTEAEGLGPQRRNAKETDLLLFLAENLEPDFLLLVPQAGSIKLIAGAVCFPSSWALEEKIGRPIEEVHGIVPDLNRSIGSSIQTFVQKLRPGVSWNRTNWGLTRSKDRNQHPSRALPRLDEQVMLDEIFFRVEEQSLVSLPRTGSILFGIRLKIVALSELKKDGEARVRLIHALETMPEAMATYKGLAARATIIRLLR